MAPIKSIRAYVVDALVLTKDMISFFELSARQGGLRMELASCRARFIGTPFGLAMKPRCRRGQQRLGGHES